LTDLKHGLQIAALAVLHDDVRVLGVLVHIVEPRDAAALLHGRARACKPKMKHTQA